MVETYQMLAESVETDIANFDPGSRMLFSKRIFFNVFFFFDFRSYPQLLQRIEGLLSDSFIEEGFLLIVSRLSPGTQNYAVLAFERILQLFLVLKIETVETYPFLVDKVETYLCGVDQKTFLKCRSRWSRKSKQNEI